MGLSNYLRQDEITQLDQAFEISLQHDSALVFWTGISPSLAKEWARRNDLKTLTMAMGSLYADNSDGSLRSQKSPKAWSKYMKGASWVFAQQACHDRRAIVLTNAPPNIYSTREHSSYREIEEPILTGFEANRHATQIDYVHPTVPGAACFCYQIWPDNRSSEWYGFLECIAIKGIVKKIVQRIKLRRSERLKELENVTPPHNESEKSISLTTAYRDKTQEAAQETKGAKRCKAEREQQAARDKKAAKQLKVEREQKAARDKKTAKQLKVEREQQAAQDKDTAKLLKVKSEQQAARDKKMAKLLKVKREQQAARDKKMVKQLKVEREQQAARDKKMAIRLKVEREQQQLAWEKKAK
ncbi:hypothetical protein LTR09_012819 [Extremus antarcticus]|uniref:Uncharacterized protein n=1 Tax=Extremus antarcticus TaxID=702011 RepID=A0AAJ0D983_9PEZI|nr:hypothetical protein LTR09_012819 [Extremus antarcticus]